MGYNANDILKVKFFFLQVLLFKVLKTCSYLQLGWLCYTSMLLWDRIKPNLKVFTLTPFLNRIYITYMYIFWGSGCRCMFVCVVTVIAQILIFCVKSYITLIEICITCALHVLFKVFGFFYYIKSILYPILYTIMSKRFSLGFNEMTGTSAHFVPR